MKKIHFISIGGSAMHNLAIALHKKGYLVTGSDDEIVEPSKSRLQQSGLLPDQDGWQPDLITADLEAVIIGMHARKDNPELLRAEELGLRIYSYPEYIYEQSKEKTRLVIGGSHGKTTTTAMIMHVLKYAGLNFDFMVGASLPGFDLTVKLTDDAPLIIIEGDEYLSSPIDPRPKFHLYRASVAVITGIAWDHVNVFPKLEVYQKQFAIFLTTIVEKGLLIFNESDLALVDIVKDATRTDLQKDPYGMPAHLIRNGLTYLIGDDQQEYPLLVFGDHNLMNLNAAFHVCLHLGLEPITFYKAIADFTGASRRLEKLNENGFTTIFSDFAHSPSKLKATTAAVKEQFPARKLIACMELHTFSSLNPSFLDQYASSMDEADTAIVYFNSHTLEHKKLPPLDPEVVKNAFNRPDLLVFTSSDLLVSYLKALKLDDSNLLLMTSGNFGGLDIKDLAFSLI